MGNYKRVVINWDNEIKNSVQFIVSANGQEVGMIKKGGSLEFMINEGAINLTFTPKAPKWFGWKVLSVNAVTTEADMIIIGIGVVYDGATLFGVVTDAVNYKNQLHTKSCFGLINYREEHLKK